MQKTPMPCDVIILTALSVECKAVLYHLQDQEEVVHSSGTIYYYGTFTGNHRVWRVAVAEIGMGGIAAALEAEKAISFFQARIALFVGIAGGIKDVKRGDVVAATKIYAYESGKAGAERFEPCPELGHSSHALEQRARAEAKNEEWLARLEGDRPDPAPQVYVGALAAGEKVLASMQSDVARLLKETYGDTLAIEMEGHGFLHAIRVNQQVYGLVIRGISDLIDDKAEADVSGAQQIAARHAAAFAFQVLAKFTLSEQDNATTHPAIWTVPFARNPFFTGREALLEQLHTQLHTTQAVALSQPQAVSGLGGIGKTHIAVEYAYRFHQYYEAIVWLQADSWEILISECLKLAGELDLPNHKEAEKVVEEVKYWLRKHRHWLLILDNVEDPQQIFHQFIPPRHQGRILITTRIQHIEPLAHTLFLSTLSEAEGVLFLLHRTKILALEANLQQASQEEYQGARNIWQDMDGLPLALDQAGAYILETGCSFADYREQFTRRRAELLHRRGKRFIGHEMSVATTFSLALERIEKSSPMAADLLLVCSLLDGDAIPEELLHEGATYLGSYLAVDCNEALGELHDYSLIQRNQETSMITLHKLVQAVIQDEMDEATLLDWVKRTMQVLDHIFPNPADVKNWSLCERYIRHLQICALWIKKCNIVSPIAARLLDLSGYYLIRRAQYDLALSPLQQAVAMNNLLKDTQEGVSLHDMTTALNNLASLYDIQGQYEQARSIYQQVLDLKERFLGSEHQGSLVVTLNNLALLYTTLEQHEQAQSFYQRALDIGERFLGPNHPHVAATLGGLAGLCKSQKQYEQAQSLYKRVLTIQMSELGPDHLDVAATLNNLADLYLSQENYEQAQPLYQQALTIQERTLGPDHPDVATILNNLAGVYYIRGEYEQAQSFYQRALTIQEHVLGSDHRDVATTLNNWATVYAALWLYEKALPLYQRAINILEPILGPNHSTVVILKENRDTAHLRANRAKKARILESLPSALQKALKQGNRAVFQQILERLPSSKQQDIYMTLLLYQKYLESPEKEDNTEI